MAMDNIDKQIAEIEDNPNAMREKDDSHLPYDPVYRVYADTKIPVAKSTGSMWHNRKKECQSHNEATGAADRWDDAIAYYQNDQSGKRYPQSQMANVAKGDEQDKRRMYTTENVVFATVSALLPATYMKNPVVEITPIKDINEDRANLYEALINTLFDRRRAPGLELKPKMRRAIVISQLTNMAYLELSYVKKEEASEQAIEQLQDLSKRLQDAEHSKDIKDIEGELMAMEHKVSFLAASGPKLRTKLPRFMHVDPNAEEVSCSDAAYMIHGDFIRTEFMQAMYGERDENGDWKSIYRPTHILPSGAVDNQGHDSEIHHFSLLNDDNETGDSKGYTLQYGYNDEMSFRQACRTLVWYVWDKTTRRVLMFNDKDWSWPIWVWDDPYNLTNFYPFFPLSFNTDPTQRNGRGEVTYYLDQQDEINRINNERARMRHWAMSKVFVDTSAFKDVTAVQQFLSQDTNQLVFGMDLADGKKMDDVFGSIKAPSTDLEQLFDTTPQFEAINRLSSLTPVLRNVEFKTNTTNKAIDSYQSGTQMRLDEKIDSIEVCVGEIARATLEMCVQFMTAVEVFALLGEEFVQSKGGWQEMSVEDFNREYNFTMAGGSSLKPTGQVKKEQAMHMGQVLGQFASASPVVVIVLLKAFERAFGDDFVIMEEEWKMINESIMAQIQGQQQEGAPQQGDEQPQQGGGGDILEEAMGQVEQIIAELAPELRDIIGQGISEGGSLKELVQQVLGLTQSNEGTLQ